MITLLLNNHNNPQQASSIKPAVDNDTGDADALKWIIFKNLVPPPLSHLPPSTPAPPSTVINTVPPLIPPISSAHGNHLTVCVIMVQHKELTHNNHLERH